MNGESWVVSLRPFSICHEQRSDPLGLADSWSLVLPGVFLSAGIVISGVSVLVLRSAPKAPGPVFDTA